MLFFYQKLFPMTAQTSPANTKMIVENLEILAYKLDRCVSRK